MFIVINTMSLIYKMTVNNNNASVEISVQRFVILCYGDERMFMKAGEIK